MILVNKAASGGDLFNAKIRVAEQFAGMLFFRFCQMILRRLSRHGLEHARKMRRAHERFKSDIPASLKKTRLLVDSLDQTGNDFHVADFGVGPKRGATGKRRFFVIVDSVRRHLQSLLYRYSENLPSSFV